MRSPAGSSVITSYSIHYTKLYDDLVLPDDLAAAEDGVDAASGNREADETAQDDYERWIGRSTTSIDQLVEEVVASGRAAAQGRIGAMGSSATPAAA